MKHLSFPRLERVFTAIFIPPKYEEPRLENWKNRSDAILAFAAIIFLAAYAAPIINPDLSRMWHYMCRTVSNAVWLIFAVEYIVRIVMAQHRWSFIRYHLFDLAIVVLPFFQPLRLLRLVFLLRILNRRASSSLRGRIATYITFAAVLITFVGALAELDVERNAPDAQITTFADSLWWAFVTVTTVGYGDLTPVTEMGRLVATGMMLFGMAFLGSLTATLASWLVDQVDEAEEEEARDELAATLAKLQESIDAQRAEIAGLESQLAKLQNG